MVLFFLVSGRFASKCSRAPGSGARRVAGRTSSASWAGTFNKPQHPEVHAMTLIRRASPWDDLFTLRRTVERLFDEDARPRFWRATFTGAEPALDITTNKDELVVKASLAGWKPDDVEITLTGNTLTIAGDAKAEERREEDSWVLNEIRHGSFSRTLELPEGLLGERATASFEHGVLTLRIPKADEIKPKQIKISVGSPAEHELVGAGSGR
jgi:HSP20 family protein